MLLYFSMFSYEYVTPALDISRPEEESMVIRFATKRQIVQKKHADNDRTKEEGENEIVAELEYLQGTWYSFGMNVGDICFLMKDGDNIVSFLRKTMTKRTYMDVLRHISGKNYEASWKIDENNKVTVFSIPNE